MVHSFPISTDAPISRAAAIADRASSDIRGLLRTEIPWAMAAMATARMVWDFEAGTNISPCNREAMDFSFTGSFFNQSQRR
jgi:hypothetical protein